MGDSKASLGKTGNAAIKHVGNTSGTVYGTNVNAQAPVKNTPTTKLLK